MYICIYIYMYIYIYVYVCVCKDICMVVWHLRRPYRDARRPGSGAPSARGSPGSCP